MEKPIFLWRSLSFAGVIYANALTSDTSKGLTPETENISSADILYQDTDGGKISTDGKNGLPRLIMKRTMLQRRCNGGLPMSMRRG